MDGDSDRILKVLRKECVEVCIHQHNVSVDPSVPQCSRRGQGTSSLSVRASQVVPDRIPRALLLCTLRLPDPPHLQRILTSSPPASYRSAGVMVRDLSGT